MCFSAAASFAVGGALVTAGGVSTRVAKKSDKLIALIPLFFGIQQIIEGVQWLFLNSGQASCVATYGFSFFAYIFWPAYVPIALWVAFPGKRHLLRWFVLPGVFVALVQLVRIILYPPVARIFEQSIDYQTSAPAFVGILYFLAIIGSLLAVGKKFFYLLAAATLIVAAFAQVFFMVTFVSVWCFFAAIVSSMICFYVWIARRGGNPVQ